jgi:hypothetical protein
MTLYVRKPTPVPALRWSGYNYVEASAWLTEQRIDHEFADLPPVGDTESTADLSIDVLGTSRRLDVGDYVVSTAQGAEVYTTDQFTAQFDEHPE